MGDVEDDEDKSGPERRATVRLVNYWMSLRRGHALPAFVDFDPHRNPISWDHCLLASCGGPTDVTLEHVGTALAEVDLDAAAVPGARLHLLGFVKEIMTPLAQAITSGEPQHCGGPYHVGGSRRMLYRSVLLPFRSLDAARHYVFGAATYRIEPVVSEEAAITTDKRPARERPAIAPARMPDARMTRPEPQSDP